LALWALLLLQVEVALPPGLDLSRGFRIVRSDGLQVPYQVQGGTITLRAPGEYRWEYELPKDFGLVEVKDDGRSLTLGTAVRYNYGVVEAPEGVDKVFNRSGYLHPIWTPDGRVISNDFPKQHLHHHGIWFPWTSSEFEGRKSDFWNSKSKQGAVEFVKTLGTTRGTLFAGFEAEHRFVNLNGPDGPKTALTETWSVRAYPSEKRVVLDLVSTQRATSTPLVIKTYHYGGLGFRGSGEWEGKDGVAFLTSEGKTRKDGHATTARWCVMTAPVGGKPASIGFLGHPSNFRAPQPMRIHPDEPFFNWAPSQGGDFSIEPGTPYVSRYRFIVADEPLSADEMNAAWKDYAEPRVAWK
jgi:hypothetical protein